MVRAKFTVQSIESSLWGKEEIKSIKLAPVYSNDPASENGKFWKASPSGEIRLGTINPEASSQFELGAEYYIDFTKVAA